MLELILHDDEYCKASARNLQCDDDGGRNDVSDIIPGPLPLLTRMVPFISPLSSIALLAQDWPVKELIRTVHASTVHT